MSDNPYAPPTAELGRGLEQPLGTGDFDFGRCLSEAWARTWSNFPLWLVASLVGLLAMLAATLTVIGLFVLVPVLMWGFFAFYLRMYDGGAELGDVFSGFSRYGQALAGMFGWWGVTFLIALVGQAPLLIAQAVGSGLGIAAGYLIYIAVNFLVTPRITFAAFLMVDRGIKLGDAISTSWERTGPLMWKLAGLMLLMIAVLFGGAIALLIGIIPASVIGYLMWTSAYRQIFGGAPQPAA